MGIAFQVSVGLSVVLFLYYGLDCLLSDGMVVEFERYGLSRYRRLTGSLEVLGAVGLIVGYFVLPVLVLASAGLTLLMALGVATRVRVRDPIAETIPAFALMLVNAYVLFYALSTSV
jgi:uncharacterized membrane protein YphA (DoxX/SURF4 family)